MGIYAVIGDPIGHTLSPAMHEFWYQRYGWDHRYIPLKVKAADLVQAVHGLLALGVEGFNVTVPHKVAIMPFLDEVDAEAERLGAVNTVIRSDDHFIGTNTDGLGFLNSIDGNIHFKAGDRALVIGAGGAARAVGLSLAYHNGLPVDFTNRTVENAKRLSEEVNAITSSVLMTIADAEKRLSDYPLIINATSVGMMPEPNQIPMMLTGLTKGTLVVDLIYRPIKTRFLEEAEAHGCTIMNGLPMLIHQGALAFKRWFNCAPDLKEMASFLVHQLQNS
ncbi:shikimate dehydrogenase [Camelliibacillus cellulosilyticus]|uniref:Shikimate dehydrogenase (NADP(+)) n=1 Tax=Camelliibacillus cellulosilyticus TaxID=2174486 RepID=A0ABV9GMB4_9BACL